jgi:hypothetical protein
MNRNLLSVSSIFVLLCSSLIGTTFAQIQIGVNQGDTFTYDISVYFSSSNQQVTYPDVFLDLNKTEWYKVAITGVSGSRVSSQVTTHYKNGTETTSSGDVELESGSNTGYWNIIASNLNVNDKFRPSGSDSLKVTETITRSYPNGQREANRVVGDFPVHDSLGDYTEHFDCYYDRKTGMPVESHQTVYFSSPSMQIESVAILRETTVWVVPEFPPLLILSLVIAAITLITIAYKKHIKLLK